MILLNDYLKRTLLNKAIEEFHHKVFFQRDCDQIVNANLLTDHLTSDDLAIVSFYQRQDKAMMFTVILDNLCELTITLHPNEFLKYNLSNKKGDENE